jgi:hypothetical protein
VLSRAPGPSYWALSIRDKLVNSNTTMSKSAHHAYCRRVHGAIWQPGRSLTQGAALIVIALSSLGLWGIIWLAVALLASVWQR